MFFSLIGTLSMSLIFYGTTEVLDDNDNETSTSGIFANNYAHFCKDVLPLSHPVNFLRGKPRHLHMAFG